MTRSAKQSENTRVPVTSALHHKFKIVGNKTTGYALFDCDTFNPWPNVSRHRFSTREAAENYAQACHNFKTGRSNTIDFTLLDGPGMP